MRAEALPLFSGFRKWNRKEYGAYIQRESAPGAKRGQNTSPRGNKTARTKLKYWGPREGCTMRLSQPWMGILDKIGPVGRLEAPWILPI